MLPVNHKPNNNEAVAVSQLSAEIIGKQPEVKEVTKLLDRFGERPFLPVNGHIGTLKTYNALKCGSGTLIPILRQAA